jgi:RES domain-containing protein
MPVKLWRIAADTRKYPCHDLSGAGAAVHPGRWNDIGQPVVYAAMTVSLAMLETAAHIDDHGLPLNRYLVSIALPDALWHARETLDTSTLPPTWAAIPAGQASVKAGSQWLTAQRLPLLLVPSVVVPEECAVLINPQHPLCRGITAQVVRLLEYNRLFRA